MPTYEYQCQKCNHQFDLFQSIADKSLTVCPKELCGMKKWGKGRVKRVIGAGAGLIFKGSGFYITDYGKDGKKDQRKAPESTKKEGGSSGSDSGSSGSDSSSKPAADKTPSKGSGSSDA